MVLWCRGAMPDIPTAAELAAIKSTVEEALFTAVPEARVLCVAIGTEMVGRPPLYHATGNPAIQVYVPDASDPAVQKLIDMVRPEPPAVPTISIPPEIAFSVIEDWLPRPGYRPCPEVAEDRKRRRILRGGIQIQTRGLSTPGTLGCFVRTLTDPPVDMALTAGHVAGDYGNVLENALVGQPDDKNRFPLGRRVIGHVHRRARDPGRVNAAVVQLRPGIRFYAGIEDIGMVTGTYTPTLQDARLGLRVAKRGAHTGTTRGVLIGMHARTEKEFFLGNDQRPRRDDQYVIQWFDDDQDVFACDGDAGAAVVDDNGRVVGILWSGGVFSYASPIDAVLGPNGCEVELITDQATPGPLETATPHRVAR